MCLPEMINITMFNRTSNQSISSWNVSNDYSKPIKNSISSTSYPTTDTSKTDDTTLGIIGLLYAFQHACIFIIIITSQRLRINKTNRILLHLNASYIFTGVVYFISAFLPTDLPALTFPGYSYMFTALSFLSIDRAVFIRWPFFYEAIPEKYHVLSLIAIPIWFIVPFSIALSKGSLDHTTARGDLSMLLKIFGVLLSMVIVATSNILIFITLRKHKRTIQHQQQNITNDSNNRGENQSRRSYRFTKKDIENRQQTTCYVYFGCVATFVPFWFPLVVVHSLQYFFDYQMKLDDYEWLFIPVGLNPISDGFIFAWFNRDFREIVKSKFKRNQIERQPSNNAPRQIEE